MAKSRKRDGYLEEDEDPARRALRLEEQATRSARQVYNLRQQVRALNDHVSNRGNIKHTKKVGLLDILHANKCPSPDTVIIFKISL